MKEGFRRLAVLGSYLGKFSRIENSWIKNRGTVVRLLSSYKVINPPEFLVRGGVSGGNVSTAAQTLLNKEKMSNKVTEDSIIWVDLEMSGLDVDTQRIMEIACVITGPNLDIIAKQESLIIKTPDEILDSMDSWCTKHHGESGLTESCRKSHLTLERAETMLVDFVSLHTKPGTCPMAGNSIYMDRVFIQKYMPRFFSHFHYRSIDVSTVKELVRRWYPQEFSNAPPKRFEHRTMSDIEESIKELEYYRTSVFKQPEDEKLSESRSQT
jgi:oligoribonuclease